MLYNKLNLSITDFCSKDSVRPELSSVLFTKNKTIATDSFVLIEVETPKVDRVDYPSIPDVKFEEMTKDIIIPANAVKKMVSNIPKNSKLPIIENVAFVRASENDAEFITTDLEIANSVKTKVVDGKYPETDQIIPKTEPKVTVRVNVKYLKKVLDFWIKNGRNYIDLEIRDESKPIVAKADFNGQNVVALVMPCIK